MLIKKMSDTVYHKVSSYDDLIKLAQNPNIDFNKLIKDLKHVLYFHRITKLQSIEFSFSNNAEQTISIHDDNDEMFIKYKPVESEKGITFEKIWQKL